MAKDKLTLENEILDKIKGKGEGSYSGYAFLDFRRNYYDRLKDPEEKALVRDILINLLKIDNFRFLYEAAWICDDLEIPGYETEIKRMIENGKNRGTLDLKLFKSVQDQIEIDRRLTEELGQMKPESNEPISGEIFNRVVTFYVKLRGDLSDAYVSKAYGKRAEAGIMRQVVQDRLLKLLRSEYRDLTFKTKAATILSDLKVRTAIPELEKILQVEKTTDDSNVDLIKESLARLKRTAVNRTI